MDTSVDRKGDRVAIWLSLAAVLGTLVGEPKVADACGCVSPPAVTAGDYAVNQRAEQIIFEVEPNWVTAHVLIKYSGKPESFGWLVPVPEVPELAISPISAFGLIDKATEPDITVDTQNLCPTSAWTCAYHDQPSCGRSSDDSPDGFGGGFADAGANGTDQPPPVTVINEQVVGDYQTVTFRANEAAAATQWLNDNGFITNPTTSIYMEPYVQANMVFVAAKLVPGAGVSSIKPLKMKYRAAFPTVPLLLTAVAADPHLTVTSYIFSDKPFRPQGHGTVTIDPNRIARDTAGRLNYPMVLARTIDEGGGDKFVIEYRGQSLPTTYGNNSCCSNGGSDFCGIGQNDKCECPGNEFDAEDCAKQGDLVEGVALVDALAEKYPTLTRITTRVSAEEMSFDPTYERDTSNVGLSGRMFVRGKQPSLAACESRVIDKQRYEEIAAATDCSSLYCGLGSTCVTTAAGAACQCAAGTVAQRFGDLDGTASVTCVPATPPVDLRAGGIVLPDACATASCGSGTCIDRNGVAVCACAPNSAARAGTGSSPRCEPIVGSTHTAGAMDYSEPLRELDVCAPPPPSCGPDGWLQKTGSTNPGVNCGGTEPSHDKTVPGAKPTCDDWFGGCVGCQSGAGGTVPMIGLAWIVGALLFRRRRAARA